MYEGTRRPGADCGDDELPDGQPPVRDQSSARVADPH